MEAAWEEKSHRLWGIHQLVEAQSSFGKILASRAEQAPSLLAKVAIKLDAGKAGACPRPTLCPSYHPTLSPLSANPIR
jgi:hypothetical protein